MKYQIIGIRQPANPSKFNQIFAKDFIWVSFRNITKITQKKYSAFAQSPTASTGSKHLKD
jgi:hypothetical protein